MEVQKKSLVPAYYQVAEAIGNKIKNGELKPESMIPSEKQLCKQYNVSRMTVRRGLAILIEAGYLESSMGKGTFVTRPKLEKLVVEFSLKGKLKSKLISAKIITAPDFVKDKLQIESGRIIFIEKIMYLENEPLVYDKKYLPYVKGKPILEADMEYAELPEMVELHTDIFPVRSEVIIKSKMLEREEAVLLKINYELSALVLEQTVYTVDNIPIGWGEAVCRGDKFSLTAISNPF